MTFPWQTPPTLDDLELPAFLRRDENNRLPQLGLPPSSSNNPQPTALVAPLPWEPSSSSRS